MGEIRIFSGRMPGGLKCVVYGPEGIGKTTFASHFPDPVFIDTEGSTKHMDVQRTERPQSWAELMSQVQFFAEHPDRCGTLVIDTADWAEQLCMDAVCRKYEKKGIEDFGYGKGYVYLREEFGKLLNLLESIAEKGINTVVTAHARMRKFEQPDELGAYDRWELKLDKNTAPLVKEWADMVLFANYKTVVVNVDGQGALKGKNKAQGGKRAMDRASGSGVFARDPDALIDMVELPVTNTLRKQIEDRAAAQARAKVLQARAIGWENEVSQDDLLSPAQMRAACARLLSPEMQREADAAEREARQTAQGHTAWRIETTLREFPRFAPINLWFDYPIHKADDSGALTDLNAEAEPERVRSAAAKKSPADRRREKEAALDAAYDFLNTGGDGIKLLDMAGYLSVSRNTLKDRLAMHGGYECSNGIVQRVKSAKK